MIASLTYCWLMQNLIIENLHALMAMKTYYRQWCHVWNIDSKKVKEKWFRYRPGVAQTVGRVIALFFHVRGTRRGWVVSSTLRPHFTPGKDPIRILQEAGWALGPVLMDVKSRPHRDSIRTVQPEDIRYTTYATRPSVFLVPHTNPSSLFLFVPFLGALAKLEKKKSNTFIMQVPCVHPSARYKLRSHCTDFNEIWCLSVSWGICRENSSFIKIWQE